jgi:hypothetical protein
MLYLSAKTYSSISLKNAQIWFTFQRQNASGCMSSKQNRIKQKFDKKYDLKTK